MGNYASYFLNAGAILLAFILIVVAVLYSSPGFAQTLVHCSDLSADDVVPAGYGSLYDQFSSAKKALLTGVCNQESVTLTAGTGEETVYIYQTGFYFDNGTWKQFSFSAADHTLGAWKKGTAYATVPLPDITSKSPRYVLAYICQWQGGAWKCGCRDNACTTPYWQMQAITATKEVSVTSTNTITSTDTHATGTNDSLYCGAGEVNRGKATWYPAPTAVSACSYSPRELPKYYAAINEADYKGSEACGACAEVQGPGGKKLTVQIVDLCAYAGNEEWCFPGSHHLDLSQDAFNYFADGSSGVIPITWKFVPCTAQDTSGTPEYSFQDGSSIWWTGITFRNLPVPLTKVEYQDASASTWYPLTRSTYNYWHDATGFGTGPYTLRLTDASGAVTLVPGVPTLGKTETVGTHFITIATTINSCR